MKPTAPPPPPPPPPLSSAPEASRPDWVLRAQAFFERVVAWIRAYPVLSLAICFPVAFMLGIVFGVTAQHADSRSGGDGERGGSAQTVKVARINSLEDAERELVGTWVYDGQDEVGMPSPGILYRGYRWLRLVAHEDGTYEFYQQPRTAGGWGEAVEKGKWEAITKKYTRTGDRWYGVRLSPTWELEGFSEGLPIGIPGRELILEQWGLRCVGYSGSAFMPTPDLYFTKGDRSPFFK